MGLKQEDIQDYFLRALQKNTLAHAYIFEGLQGTGKKNMAVSLAQAIFCLQPDSDHAPCESCSNCERIAQGQHPDVRLIEAEGATIKVDQIRQLKTALAQTGVEGNRQLFIIDEAEKMTVSAANSLLKFLEEPEGNTVVLLLTTAKNRLLPTILSRSQLIHFSPLDPSSRKEQLIESGVPKEKAALLTQLTQDYDQALRWHEDDWFNQVVKELERLITYLERKSDDAFPFIQTNLIPLLKDRDEQSLALDIFLQLLRGKAQTDLANATGQTQNASLFSITTVLEGMKMHNSYVTIQNVFEYIVLTILAKE